MPFELRDFQDLVRLLREHPDWREELRALLLTHELLTLPVLVRELAEGQERLTETVAQLTVRLDQLTARMDQLTETVAQLAEEQRRLTGGQQRFEVQMAEMRGWFLEERYRTHAPAYFGRFLRQVQPVHMGRLADALRERLAEGELAEVLLADLILTGRLPTPGGPVAIWIVVEVSTTVDRRDVERAQRRAGLLRQARYPAVAVAGGREATAGARQAASETGVALLLDGRIDGWQDAVDHILAEGEEGSP
jgi:cell division protein FtsB